MGRAGSGGRGGGHSSGGGHRSSRSGGGHRVGSSGRSGSRAGSFGGSRGPTGSMGGPKRGPMVGPGMIPHVHGTRRGYAGSGSGGCVSGCFGGCLSPFIIFFIVVLIFAAVVSDSQNTSQNGTSQDSVQSTIVREKIDSKNAYINDCIVDELGWFDNITATEKKLKGFWQETGVQPYVILKAYDSSLTTDQQKEDWTTDYYDQHFDTENIFLYIYFAEENQDEDVGYMCYANGYETSSVMDSEAVEIFWNYIDRYWYSDMSTDDLFVTVFDKTADTIMHTAKTKYDAIRSVSLVLAVAIGGIVLVIVITKRNKRKKEEAQERQRILETPLEELVREKEQKYKE